MQSFVPQMEIMEELRAFDSDRFNFVTFNDVFVSGGHVCLELEILDMSLFEFLYQKPRRSLELDEIRPILYQVSVTLQLLQSLGVVHTDLKPENIMLLDHRKQPWRIKVIDFGVACHAATSELGDYMQTQNYRSPEIILGFPITSAIDMWSLGCITAELFTGTVLYPGDTDHEMLQHIVQTQGHPPARLMYRGVKTRWFFNCRRKDGRRRWRLKQCGETNTSAGQFNSLDDIITLKPARHLLDEDTAAETEDRREFLDLLKKTLHLDIDRRISPSELLQHPFITLNHLAQNHQNGFYVKSSCEKMEVCLDQSGGFDGGQMTPSISGAEGPPRLVQDPRTPPHPGHLVPEPTIRVAEIKRGTKRTWDTFVASGLRKRVKGSPESKKIKWDDSEAEIKRGRKRTWDTFLASHIASKKQINSSPERKKRKLDDSEAERKRGRKRTWDTFVASGLRKQINSSPERKKRKLDDSEAERKRGRKRTWDTFVASGLRKRVKGSPESKKIKWDDSEAERKRGTKRTWDTFLASHIASKKQINSSPERKKRKLDDSEAERKRGTKRTWDTFLASHIESKKQINSSPERKKRKLDDSEAERKRGTKRTWDTFVASGLRKRVKGSPESKKIKWDDSEAERKRGTKRSWDTFLASHIASKKQINSSPERKKRKLDDSEAERKRGTKRTWDTFLASHIESKNERSGSPERKKRKTSLEEEETNTQGSSLSTGKRKRRPGDPPEGEEEPRCRRLKKDAIPNTKGVQEKQGPETPDAQAASISRRTPTPRLGFQKRERKRVLDAAFEENDPVKCQPEKQAMLVDPHPVATSSSTSFLEVELMLAMQMHILFHSFLKLQKPPKLLLLQFLTPPEEV
ncbi:hypothetical protein CgunFtcFv8_018914 [Champsocephalus gunnari]|uniref:Protein kinase domain-containing protein n=1 Tax=Champsocephalus gunnari TaxID=52237 RepID=A0AAN8DG04_CHAGU|nr:hypothetical protein CgunFtcFv8_018914 [Champsocephalus gunnari]